MLLTNLNKALKNPNLKLLKRIYLIVIRINLKLKKYHLKNNKALKNYPNKQKNKLKGNKNNKHYKKNKSNQNKNNQIKNNQSHQFQESSIRSMKKYLKEKIQEQQQQS